MTDTTIADITPDEELIRLAEVPAMLPPFEDGRRIAAETVRRWTRRGVRGHVLPSRTVGGRMYTSRRAVRDFQASIEG